MLFVIGTLLVCAAGACAAQSSSEILEKLKAREFRVFDERVRLHPLRKGMILGGYLLRSLVTRF